MSLLLISCANQPANAQSGDEPVFSVTKRNQDDEINIQHGNGVTIIDIHSPTGIGSAEFELSSGAMPEKIVLRLHLKGLEEFRLMSRQATIAASVSSSGSFDVANQRVISAGREYSITSKDPLWVKIEIISGQPTKKIPLEDGYFEITCPKVFLQKSGSFLAMQWIDFYR